MPTAISAADDRRDAKRVEGSAAPHPGADAGQQFHVAGSHAADGIRRQQEHQADDRSQQAPAEPCPAEVGGAVDPAAMISGNVIQFGTRSFQPSITAATISTALSSQKDHQCSERETGRVLMSGISGFSEDISQGREESAGRRWGSDILAFVIHCPNKA